MSQAPPIPAPTKRWGHGPYAGPPADWKPGDIPHRAPSLDQQQRLSSLIGEVSAQARGPAGPVAGQSRPPIEELMRTNREQRQQVATLERDAAQKEALFGSLQAQLTQAKVQIADFQRREAAGTEQLRLQQAAVEAQARKAHLRQRLEHSMSHAVADSSRLVTEASGSAGAPAAQVELMETVTKSIAQTQALLLHLADRCAAQSVPLPVECDSALRELTADSGQPPPPETGAAGAAAGAAPAEAPAAAPAAAAPPPAAVAPPPPPPMQPPPPGGMPAVPPTMATMAHLHHQSAAYAQAAVAQAGLAQAGWAARALPDVSRMSAANAAQVMAAYAQAAQAQQAAAGAAKGAPPPPRGPPGAPTSAALAAAAAAAMGHPNAYAPFPAAAPAPAPAPAPVAPFPAGGGPFLHPAVAGARATEPSTCPGSAGSGGCETASTSQLTPAVADMTPSTLNISTPDLQSFCASLGTPELNELLEGKPRGGAGMEAQGWGACARMAPQPPPAPPLQKSGTAELQDSLPDSLPPSRTGDGGAPDGIQKSG